MSSKAWLIYEKQRIRFEKKHQPAIKKALDAQMKFFADKVKAGQDIRTDFPIENLTQVIRTLYENVGLYFAKWQERELGRSLKAFNVPDTYLNEITEYFRLHLLEAAVLPITARSKAICLAVIEQGTREGWSAEKIAIEIMNRGAQLNHGRTRNIARTETGKAANLGKWTAARQFRFKTAKVWVSAGDRRVRPQPEFNPDSANHIVLNGKEAELDAPFDNGMMFPGDPNGGANEVCNCRCTLVFKTIKDANGRPIPTNSRYIDAQATLPNASILSRIAEGITTGLLLGEILGNEQSNV